MEPARENNPVDRNPEHPAGDILNGAKISPVTTLARALSADNGIELIEGEDDLAARINAGTLPEIFAIRDLPALPEDFRLPEGVSGMQFERASIRCGDRRVPYWKGQLELGCASTTEYESVEKSPFQFLDGEEAFSEAIANAELSGRREDHGIGAYEFWGARGVHHNWQFSIEDGSGDVAVEFASDCYPLVAERSRASRSFFVVTSSKYSARDDEVYEDGYDQDVDFSGTLEKLHLREETVTANGKREKFWVANAHYSWEQG
jgi:hypothetical protein